MRGRFKAIAASAAIVATTVGITACSSDGGQGASAGAGASATRATTGSATPSATVTQPRASSSTPAHVAPHRDSAPVTGLFIQGGSPALATFRAQTGVKPKIVLNFGGWGKDFMANWASNVTAGGGLPLLQIGMGKSKKDPPLIASGADDAYLASFARQVRDFGHPIILSYGHEMNGAWYSWGWKRTTPTTFVAAWRHIVKVFRAQGATNVTWLWTVQAYADSPAQTTSPGRWWPGSDYVTWVGVDGHYLYAGETFHTIFDPILSAVENITSKPILIAETAISPKVGQESSLPDLFEGVASGGLLGLVYFDTTGNADYRLQSSAALAAYGEAAKKYGYAS
jgi:hypothetical protein